MAWVGLGKRVNRPSSSIALAPWLVSSPGWAIMTRVPDHWRAHRRQPPRGADPGGHVGVVAAGMGDDGVEALAGLAARPAGERQAGPLLHRQRVHVGAQQQHRAGPVLQHRDDAGAADAGGDGEAGRRASAAIRAALRVSCMLSSGLAWRSR